MNKLFPVFISLYNKENTETNFETNFIWLITEALNMKFVCPLLVVEDLARSRQFYREVLDQKEKFDLGENVTFEGDFALHRKAHFEKLLNVPSAEHPSPVCHNHELYFEEDKIKERQLKLMEHRVRFLHTMREQPWGQRVIRFYDPDGHVIEVGESMEAVVRRLSEEGLSPEEISEKIGMPIEFVKYTLH
jgi:catechol 2,3-dioxygenase-like lactoylglutathione lyase family enzyme